MLSFQIAAEVHKMPQIHFIKLKVLLKVFNSTSEYSILQKSERGKRIVNLNFDKKLKDRAFSHSRYHVEPYAQ